MIEIERSIGHTQSLCPVCMKKIDGMLITEGTKTYLEKECSEHGVFKTLIWEGVIPMEEWVRDKERAQIANPITQVEQGCPFDCGLCKEHRQHTCTALIEVTKNCNLNCRFCFADSNIHQEVDPNLDQIRFMYKSILTSSGTCNIQLSGGEPTTRDDLPLIVKIGKELGFKFIQINTNGIRFAEEDDYVYKLKEAGVDSIFLQFDGTNNEIYQKLRGRSMLQIKIKAIEACEKYGIGVVLVPTLVPGINVDDIGNTIKFALEYLPTVRGVHFQPVSYFGRVPQMPRDDDRITLPTVMEEIEKQTGGMIKLDSMKPPGCENALCSFHGSYMYQKDGMLKNTSNNKSCNCKSEKAEEGAKKAKDYVARTWAAVNQSDPQQSCNVDPSGWDKILQDIHKNSFSISGMAFQDVWNVDLERVKDCCIHVVSPQGKLIPFCLYNLTDDKGGTLYRNREMRNIP